jgi:hypothetical protein
MDRLHLNNDGDIGLSTAVSPCRSAPSFTEITRPQTSPGPRNGSSSRLHLGQADDPFTDSTPRGEGSNLFTSERSELAAQASTKPRSRLNSSFSRTRSLNLKIPSVDATRADQSVSAHPCTQHRTSFSPLSPTRQTVEPAPRRHGPLIGDETAQKMSRWIKEIVVCNFDLERGPVVERRVGSRRWGPGEKENV